MSFGRPDSKEVVSQFIEERKKELDKLLLFITSSLECYRVRVSGALNP